MFDIHSPALRLRLKSSAEGGFQSEAYKQGAERFLEMMDKKEKRVMNGK